ncbi:MAG TPA: hypothetical protein VLA82_06350 [Actinomycetota bacterium]|nr:hypothetical protein [Actinomycetota bacterium]
MSERNLRDLLGDAAADIPAFAPAPEVAVRRARRRAALSVGTACLALLLAVLVAVPIASSLAGLSEETPASGSVIDIYPIGGQALPMATVAAYGSVWTLEQSAMGEGMGWNTELVGRHIDGGDEWVRRSLGQDAGGQWVQLRAGFGAIWALSPTREELIKVDPATGQIAWRHQVPARGFDIGSGGVWTIGFTGDAMKYGTLDPQAVNVVPVGKTPIGIASAWDTVWVVDDFDGTVRRIDAITEEVTAKIRTGVNLTGDIAADGRGAYTIGCRALDGSRDTRVELDACELVLITIDPSTNTVARMTPLAGSSTTAMGPAHWAFVESVDSSGVWVVVSEAACARSPFAPCDGDVLLRFAHDGASLLERIDGMEVTDATSADGDLWIADAAGNEIVRWRP